MEFSNASHCSLNIYLFILFFYLFLLIILPSNMWLYVA